MTTVFLKHYTLSICVSKVPKVKNNNIFTYFWNGGEKYDKNCWIWIFKFYFISKISWIFQKNYEKDCYAWHFDLIIYLISWILINNWLINWLITCGPNPDAKPLKLSGINSLSSSDWSISVWISFWLMFSFSKTLMKVLVAGRNLALSSSVIKLTSDRGKAPIES